MQFQPLTHIYTFPGTDVQIEVRQDDEGDVNVQFSTNRSHLLVKYDKDAIAQLGFPVNPSVQPLNCGEMVAEVQS